MMTTLLAPLTFCFPGPSSPGRHAGRSVRCTTLPLSGEAAAAPAPPARISSTANTFVKHCVKLRISSSYRRSHGSALVIGLTPIMEICRFQEVIEEKQSIIECLLLLDGVEIPKKIIDSSASVVHVNSVVMKKLCGMQSVDSVDAIAVMKIPTNFYDIDSKQEASISPKWSNSPLRLLALDGIQDPGNLGTLVRSAMAFKWDCVFLLPGCCDPFNEKALRAARGASFQLPVISGNWFHLEVLRTNFQMKMLAGHPWTYSERSQSPSFLSREFADSLAGDPLCLVLGSEGHGLSEQTMQTCELVGIPMEGMFESLNVSVAGGIFLFMLQPNHNI